MPSWIGTVSAHVAGTMAAAIVYPPMSSSLSGAIPVTIVYVPAEVRWHDSRLSLNAGPQMATFAESKTVVCISYAPLGSATSTEM